MEKIMYLVDDYLSYVLKLKGNTELILRNFTLAAEYGLRRTIERHLQYYASIDENCLRIGEWKDIDYAN